MNEVRPDEGLSDDEVVFYEWGMAVILSGPSSDPPDEAPTLDAWQAIVDDVMLRHFRAARAELGTVLAEAGLPGARLWWPRINDHRCDSCGSYEDPDMVVGLGEFVVCEEDGRTFRYHVACYQP